MTQTERSLSLLETPAEKRTVDILYAKGLINQQSYDLALELLYPHQRWGYWTANLFLILGISLLLVGIVFLFAFNWQKMSTFHKFSTIEAALLCSIVGAWAYSAHAFMHKLFLIAASILVGVFLAVFGQVYQTGAEHYQLFALWTLLITPWAILGRSTPLWALWIVLLNVSIILYWLECVEGNVRTDDLIFAIILVLNIFILASTEYITHKSLSWFEGRWLKFALVIFLLLAAAIPINNLILLMTGHHSILVILNLAMLLGAAIGIALHCGLIGFYAFKSPDIWMLTLTGISVSLLLCELAINILDKIGVKDLTLYFIMAVFTLCVFSATAYLLRRVNSKIMEKVNI